MTDTIPVDDPIVYALVQIHNRLAEISRYLEICTAKFTHINATEMHYVKEDTISFDDCVGDFVKLSENKREVDFGYDHMHGLHYDKGDSGSYECVIWDDDEDERELSVNDDGEYVKRNNSEENNNGN